MRGPPQPIVIGGAPFRRLYVIPSCRNPSDKNRAIVVGVEIWMQPSQQQRYVAPKLMGTGLRVRTKHSVAVGVRRKQNLLDEKRSGPPHDVLRSIDCERSGCFHFFVTSHNAQQGQHIIRQGLGPREPDPRRGMQKVDGSFQCHPVRHHPSADTFDSFG
ncbi:MAG: hypothetical protein WBD53_12445 [Xanthobacteraceae bacterium]